MDLGHVYVGVPAIGHAGTILDSVKIVSPASRSDPKVYRAISDLESVQAAMYTAGDGYPDRQRLDTVDQTREKCSNSAQCGNDL